ncbi:MULTISPECIES: acetoacetate--CoA ligase [Gammaproteobacteria]|uniref:acetoacetate--CoA ligase n=1 Tax=Gammaproteobacteria TaxID=1236 RepID=UPI000DCFBEC2|nr:MULTISPECIES: acetoacetate--CoA ligase [Gammaproteobacteria]RTE87381.1 acetoacetate--CoA ligase [Aliidiomarina sp. B3213]TCZ92833.1 acetoacetate--CoA ligase [Lysobacter sp. N42]
MSSEVSQPLWKPSQETIKSARMTDFMNYVEKSENQRFQGRYSSLYDWSIQHKDTFWSMIWDYFDVIGERGERTLINEGQMPGAQWFPDAKLNFAENLLRYRDNRPALIFQNEHGQTQELSYQQLYSQVAALASALKKAGVKPGDRVAGMLPNCNETIVAMLATTSLGAVWSSCSPDFGEQGVLDRFGQVEPKVVFVVDGYFYNGKTLNISDKVNGILDKLSSVESKILIPFAGIEHQVSDCIEWNDFLDHQAESIEFEPRCFNDPLYIMFSSGTTGVPKCIVHGIGGTLLQHYKEHGLHTNLRREDTLFYFTTCGWMMWNWLVSGLAIGARLSLFDGSPFYPNENAMPDLIDKQGITVFGTSAKYLSALEKAGAKPKETHNLSSLKAVLTTGSVLPPESFDYVYRDFKEDVCLSSISGGTDIISCFALGNPILPVYRGQLQCRGLGLAVDVFNEQGEAVRNEKGELVCTQTFPCMPIGFWNDSDGSRYQSAYFERFKNIWAHGDYAEITDQDGVIIYGRSDAVLNPGGVRIGTAEIYRQVEKVDEVLESIAVGQNMGDDERVVLFVRLRENIELNDDLIKKIKQTIRANATPRHVPAVILQVADIPRTISGKIVELAVRQVIHGETVKNTDALANPEALDLFKDRSELTL